MFGSTVLEVVIGLVFLYLSLSLICSALNEYYSALFSRRATHLRDSLFSIFNKDDPRGLSFLVDFYTHPLISGLSPAKRAVTSTAARASAATSVRYLVPGLPWYQAAVVFPARVWADLAGRVARWAGYAIGALRWVIDAFRDPYGVGGFFSGMRKELADAARSTPTYIPDRAFSGALFAVLASDGDALRRLRVELRVQLADINKVVQSLADPKTANALARGLVEADRSLGVKVGAARTPEVIMDAARDELAKLIAIIPANSPDRLALDARGRIEKALEAVLAAGPRIPSPEQVRDHVWTTLEASLRRLEASFASLPAGALQAGLVAKAQQSSAGLAAAKATPPMSLEQARAAASRAFAEIRGTIDGLNAQVGWQTAAGWVEREVAALAASETDLITIAKLRDAVQALPESDIRAALLSLMDEVGDDLERVKRNIQVWYNDSMERVSGWYKRNTQVILALIAVGIAGALNADTIAIAERLWTDSTLRANVNAVAKSVDPATLAIKPADPNPKEAESTADDLNRAAKTILKESNLPLGWDPDELDRVGFGKRTLASLRSFQRPAWDETKTEALLVKLLGLGLTAIAVSMGAPFWFDILNKLVNVRTAGLQPQKTTDRPVVAAPKA